MCPSVPQVTPDRDYPEQKMAASDNESFAEPTGPTGESPNIDNSTAQDDTAGITYYIMKKFARH